MTSIGRTVDGQSRQTMVQMDGPARRSNQARLRELRAAHGDQIEIFCAHDDVELARYTRTTESV